MTMRSSVLLIWEGEEVEEVGGAVVAAAVSAIDLISQQEVKSRFIGLLWPVLEASDT
jgi:hypothetical protein